VLISVVMFLLNSDRVEDLVRRSVPALLPSETNRFSPLPLQTLRANLLMTTQGEWQRAALRRLDRAQLIAQRMELAATRFEGHWATRFSMDRSLLSRHSTC